jgi:hypothetical protein
MKGMRYIFVHGDEEHVVEFTHHEGCVQPEDAWVAAHQRAHAKAVSDNCPGRSTRVEVFDSDVPVNRGFYRPTQNSNRALGGVMSTQLYEGEGVQVTRFACGKCRKDGPCFQITGLGEVNGDLVVVHRSEAPEVLKAIAGELGQHVVSDLDEDPGR